MTKFVKVLPRIALIATWYITVMLWPFIKWVVSLNCFLQLMRMIYRWDTPGALPLLTFGAHFAVLVGLTWFVSSYRPSFKCTRRGL